MKQGNDSLVEAQAAKQTTFYVIMYLRFNKHILSGLIIRAPAVTRLLKADLLH